MKSVEPQIEFLNPICVIDFKKSEQAIYIFLKFKQKSLQKAFFKLFLIFNETTFKYA